MRDGPVVDLVQATLISQKPWPGKGKRWRRQWELEVSCGHILWRSVQYRIAETSRYQRERSIEDILPPPKRVFCEGCGSTDDHPYRRWKV
jgi:hypothetical protein